MASDAEVLALAKQQLPPFTRWVISIDRTPELVVRAEHPASSGMILDLSAVKEADVVLEQLQEWMKDREFQVADAAPQLEHSAVVAGVRALAAGFAWPAPEVRAVAFLLYEAGGLTREEAGWLAGFVAPNAPMIAEPPTP